MLTEGKFQIYAGTGKGKTTAALGQALRAASHGLRTYFAQFMKKPGERRMGMSVLIPDDLITIRVYGRIGFLTDKDVSQLDVDMAIAGLVESRIEMMTGGFDIIVLDEVLVARKFGLLTDVDLIDNFLDARPQNVEVIMTGDFIPPALFDRADLITDMRKVKHYYDQGVQARKGIEY